MGAGSSGLQPRKQPVQARAELTRQRILGAAAHVFAEYGYAAGTTNRIAAQARISIGSLYQYYPNKDAILVELMSRHLDSGASALTLDRERIASTPLDELIRQDVHLTISNHLDDPQLLRVMMEQAPHSTELLAKTAEYREARIAYAEDLIAHHPEARVEDPHVAARLLVSTVALTVHQLIAAPDSVEPDRLENELVTMLTRYLKGDPTP
ncbi:TetR/AcrR family transcriptional regulator [Streptomyces sp. NPDC048172]|uniref:TetR/AcrR family transcriptional regulator n=1 Tax=Streptomyces sp. NPDC048172 TaxID=3365505 RepID=UPI003717B1AF